MFKKIKNYFQNRRCRWHEYLVVYDDGKGWSVYNMKVGNKNFRYNNMKVRIKGKTFGEAYQAFGKLMFEDKKGYYVVLNIIKLN